jgi:hypothetical protein
MMRFTNSIEVQRAPRANPAVTKLTSWPWRSAVQNRPMFVMLITVTRVKQLKSMFRRH